MISVDRFDIITPQGIGKRIKEEKILYWFGVYCMRVYQPGNRVSNSSLKRNIYRCFLITAARGNGDNAKPKITRKNCKVSTGLLVRSFHQQKYKASRSPLHVQIGKNACFKSLVFARGQNHVRKLVLQQRANFKTLVESGDPCIFSYGSIIDNMHLCRLCVLTTSF